MFSKLYRFILRFAIAVLAALTVSCTKNAEKTRITLNVSSKSVSAQSTFPVDQRVCFGVNVRATDIESTPQSTCEPELSLIDGFVEDGGVLEVLVPSGEDRQFELFAYLLPVGDTTAACPSWDAHLDYGSVFKVGATTDPVDLAQGELIIEIPVSFPGLTRNVKDELGLQSCADDGTQPPSEFNLVSIYSSNANSNYAMTGDSIYLNFQTDLPQADISATIFGFPATITPLGSGLYQATYVTTGVGAEGIIPFELIHTSGNKSSTDDGSTVTYDQTAPLAPTGIAMGGPAISIGSSATPTLLVQGVESNAYVEIFSDSGCGTLLGSATSTSTSVSVTSSGISPESTITVYARQTDPAGNVSPCSTIFQHYRSTALNPFISTWETTAANETIELPLRAGFAYNFIVDWGDGQTDLITAHNAPERIHTYVTPGTHTVTISGTVPTFYFNNTGDADKIQTVPELGDVGWTNFESMFFGCNDLTLVAGGNTSAVTNMAFMFRDAPNATPITSSWNTANVTLMTGMFRGATSANPDVSGWNVNNVTIMSDMFRGAGNFNQDISGWNVSAVTNMQGMFQQASNFNQDISSWNVANVVNMAAMFADASSFNHDIGLWNVGNVTSTAFMFQNASAFNQDITSWNVGSVATMNHMFNNAAAFNQPLNSWNVGNVTNMANMFDGATSANPDVSGWNTTSLGNMYRMFFNASSADPVMGAWTVTGIANMDGAFNGSGLSTANFDLLLTTLASNSGTLQTGVTLGAAGINYTLSTSATAVATLTAAPAWTIDSAGGI